MKRLTYLLVSAVMLLVADGIALAHKVNLFAYAEGGKVYTESYFPDGKPVESGKVLVYDSRDNLLLEGATDKEGLFGFAIPKVDDLNIVIEAGMGHKNSFKLKKAEVEAGK
ncbi:MAG: carboxypeptidase regulatory-like domain-containing protein [Desulfobacterales bacterium]|nr:carboxypeptidase regulatory-like domain-containing protein [Desulfobacterales bacterium]